MNLVQIQNRLKEMPTQVVMGYANGSNPQVPPYLALGELNRRKQMEQESKSAEAPQQSVKDQIEQQVKLMQTMAGRQQEAMQQQGQMLGQQSMIAPKSTPVTDAEGFAAGGLTGLPTELRFNRGGGIVAFAAGDKVTEDADLYRKKFLEEMTKPELITPKSPLAVQKEMMAERPELAEKAGSRFEKLLDQIAARDQEDRERFKQEQEGRQGRRLTDVLMGAGAGLGKFAPKAQTGGAGILNLLGGIGQQAGAMREADIERLNKQRGLERDQDIIQAKMLNEIDNARRAEARGDVKAMQEHEQKVAELKSQFQANRLTAFGKAADITETARRNLVDEALKRQQLETQRAQVARMGPQVTQAYDFIRKEFPSLNPEQALEKAVSITNAGITAGSRLDAETMKKVADIDKRFGMLIAGATDPATKQKFQEQRDKEVRAITGGIGTLPTGGGAGVSTAGFGEPQRVK